ncbi:MAG: hypothetical protein Q9210_002751 [Variospora velana]
MGYGVPRVLSLTGSARPNIQLSGAIVYNCSDTEWCCDEGLVFRGCCSDSGKLLELDGRQLGTTIALGAAPTTARRTSSTTRSDTTSPSDSTLAASSNVASSSVASSSSPTAWSSESTTSTVPGSSTTAVPNSVPAITTSNTNSPPPPPPPAANSNNLGVKIGAGVGVPLGVALIAALIYILYLRNMRRRKSVEELPAPTEGPSEIGVSPGVDEPQMQMLDGKVSSGHYGGYGMHRDEMKAPIAQLQASEHER